MSFPTVETFRVRGSLFSRTTAFLPDREKTFFIYEENKKIAKLTFSVVSSGVSGLSPYKLDKVEMLDSEGKVIETTIKAKIE